MGTLKKVDATINLMYPWATLRRNEIAENQQELGLLGYCSTSEFHRTHEDAFTENATVSYIKFTYGTFKENTSRKTGDKFTTFFGKGYFQLCVIYALIRSYYLETLFIPGISSF